MMIFTTKLLMKMEILLGKVNLRKLKKKKSNHFTLLNLMKLYNKSAIYADSLFGTTILLIKIVNLKLMKRLYLRYVQEYGR